MAYDQKFKNKVVADVRNGMSMQAAGKRHKVSAHSISIWVKQTPAPARPEPLKVNHDHLVASLRKDLDRAKIMIGNLVLGQAN